MIATADGDQEPGHRVQFQVESSREVANDWIRAVVGTTAEAVESAAVAAQVNDTMAWALDQARREKRVDVKSGGYQTYPVHEKGKLRRWRASQDVMLEGGDTEAMTELVGKLQTRLELRSFQFSVARETREQVQEELVVEALRAFQKRAKLVSDSLGAGDYAIDNISINTGGRQVPPPMMRAESMVRSKGYTAPAVEAGNSRVTVSVSGSIVLE